MRRTTSALMLLCICVGIFLSNLWCPSLPLLQLLGLFTVCTIIILWLFKSSLKSHRPIALLGLLLLICLGFCSMSLHLYNIGQIKENLASAFYDCKVQITQIAKQKNNYVQAEARLLSVNNEDKIGFIKILINSKEKGLSQLKAGDEISGKWYLSQLSAASNPHQFDYATYLENNNVFFQTWIKDEDWSMTREHTGFHVFFKAKAIKSRCAAIIESKLRTQDHQAIISAMVLGDKSEMSAKTKSIFSETGSIHVMAVSGLHVGVIYLFLIAFTRMFKFFTKKHEWLSQLFIIAAIWCYALVTGMAPSVLRASFMLSLFIVAKLMNRSTNIYQILMVTASIILMLDPSQLFKLSFQFSYLALLGIVYFKPVLDKYIWSQYRVLKPIIALINVSLAAQIFIFPLMLYHFHQFPLFFVISSLIAIPIASVIIWLSLLGILTGLFASLDIISHVIFQTLELVIVFLLGSMSWLQAVPGHLIKGIYVNKIEFVGIYCVMVALVMWRETGLKKYLYATAVIPCLVLLASTLIIHKSHDKTSLFIYHKYGQSLIELQEANQAFLINPDDLSQQSIQNIRQNNGMANYLQSNYTIVEEKQITKNKYAYNTSIKIIHKTEDCLTDTIQSFKTILIRNEAVKKLRELPQHWQKSDLVFDGSNSKNFIKDLQKKYPELNIFNTYQQAYQKIQ